MKKITLLIFALLYSATFAQLTQNSFWDNVRFGGGFGFSFGNNTTTFSISPTGIYDFNDNFSAGIGAGYQYSKRNNIKSNVYSLSLLSLFNPINEIQLSAEFEQLFASQKFKTQTVNRNYPALHIGASYRISRNVALGIRYDILHKKDKSIYASAISPVVRVFF